MAEAPAARNRRPERFEELSAAIDARLRQLPLKRPGFEERTRQADWVFLGLWPIGDDLAPVIEQRAGDIAFLILRKHQPRPATKPSEAARDVALKFRAFAKAWRDLPEGARPSLNWGALSLAMRSSLKAARLGASATAKGEVADMIAVAYLDLTGNEPSRNSKYDTPFSRLVEDIFEIGDLDDGFAVAGHAAKRFKRLTA